MLYHRPHRKLLDNLPPPNAMPYLERIHALPAAPPHPATTTSITPEQRRSQSMMDLALPDFKTLLDDLSNGGGGGSGGSGTLVESPGASMRGWNPLVASSRSSSATQHSIELRVKAVGLHLFEN